MGHGNLIGYRMCNVSLNCVYDMLECHMLCMALNSGGPKRIYKVWKMNQTSLYIYIFFF